MSVEQMYQEIILDHYKARHGSGLRDPYEAEVTHVNPSCGDEVMLRVHLDGDRVADVSYDAIGCSISQASLSVMVDLCAGKTVDEAMELFRDFHELMESRGAGLQDEAKEEKLEDAVVFQGVSKYPMRIKCALLGWEGMRDSVAKALAAK